jgi:hypothetical protein
MAVLNVGPGQQYTTLSSAIAAAKDGDVIDVQAGTYTNDFAIITHNITIQGVGGMVNLVATTPPPNGKAILTTDADVTINNVAFSGAKVADNNGAGIRYETGNLTLNNDYFHDNQEGLLAASNPQGSITINDSTFSHNGDGSGSTHNIYVNEVGTLTINHSSFIGAVVGHEIKSRADNTIIENSLIEDGPTGSASYSIDLPNGGNAVIRNNVIEQGPQTQNPAIIAFGEEGNVHANSNLQITGNTIVNDLASSSALALWNNTNSTVSLTNNQFYGLSTQQIVVGPATQTGTTFLSVEPALALPADNQSPTVTAQAPTLTVQQTIAGTEGGSVPLTITAAQASSALPATNLSITISGLAGGTLNHGTRNSDGSYRLSVGDLQNLTYTPDPAIAGTLDLHVVATDTESGGAANTAAEILVTLAATAPSSGSGLTLHVSGDAWQGDPQFTVSVDGKQVGGPYDVSAAHGAGQWQDVTIAGNFSAAKEVDVTFLNDAWGGNASADRNLYVQSLAINGSTYLATAATNGGSLGITSTDPNAAELFGNGTLAFQLASPQTTTPPPQTTTPPPPASGAGLTLHVSGDAWQGDAQFVVTVDGKQVGGPYDVSASHGAGQWQDVTIGGDFSAAKEVDVTFLNDAWGGTASTDRNLYVQSLAINGSTYLGTAATNGGSLGITSTDPQAAELYGNGTLGFHLTTPPATTPTPPTTPPASGAGLTLSVSADTYLGDPKFVVTVDGKQVGGPYDVSALHGAGQWQNVTVAGDFSTAKEVDVTFLNDAWGGTATTDRNLYVDTLSVNGLIYQASAATNGGSMGYASTDPHAAELYGNGTLAFHLASNAS